MAERTVGEGVNSQIQRKKGGGSNLPKPKLPKPPKVKVTPQKVTSSELINPWDKMIKSDLPMAPLDQGKAAQAKAPKEFGAAQVDTATASDKVDQVFDNLEFAEGELSEDATVQGQLSQLMEQFEGGEVPPWAAGAIRNANAVMAQRGIGASSMAGQAILQAAMESALPIAQQDASQNFQMEMQNLSNEQQAIMVKNSGRLEAMLTDAAAENASRQFNASSQNQVKQFLSGLKAQVSQFNAEQSQAMELFNTGEKNAYSKFKAQMKNQRQQFNVSNRLVIDQANAAWRRTVSTQNNANKNEANRIDAAAKLQFSLSEINNMYQERRDIIHYAFTAAENENDRATQLVLANLEADELDKSRSHENKREMFEAIGGLVGAWLR